MINQGEHGVLHLCFPLCLMLVNDPGICCKTLSWIGMKPNCKLCVCVLKIPLHIITGEMYWTPWLSADEPSDGGDRETLISHQKVKALFFFHFFSENNQSSVKEQYYYMEIDETIKYKLNINEKKNRLKGRMFFWLLGQTPVSSFGNPNIMFQTCEILGSNVRRSCMKVTKEQIHPCCMGRIVCNQLNEKSFMSIHPW